eukprot:TRINITY_DN39669_c0_g1_i1.p1 TRINITY_DN39669_c0_g1~~TRINITY_DN39669_c0_g1_i1.p1  ORF type:complete len:173 (+),score=52.93 TRINITY_DN39669_c0_g1_i1:88-606(+)
MFTVFFFFFFFKQKTAYEMLRSLVGSEMCIRDSYVGGYIHTVVYSQEGSSSSLGASSTTSSLTTSSCSSSTTSSFVTGSTAAMVTGAAWLDAVVLDLRSTTGVLGLDADFTGVAGLDGGVTGRESAFSGTSLKLDLRLLTCECAAEDTLLDLGVGLRGGVWDFSSGLSLIHI